MQTSTHMKAQIKVHDLSVSYGRTDIIKNLSLGIPKNKITTIIGPNGCGKSTLLNSLCTLIPYSGTIELAGKDVSAMRRKDRAKQLTLLPQHPISPDGVTVGQLISRGRHPHQSWWRQWSPEDEQLVNQALDTTGLTEFANRRLNELSGGQRQRVWIAMVLAQNTETLLLDEPTTYLDLAHSLEVLRLVQLLRQDQEKTVVMVLHDLNLAIRFSDNLVVMLGEGGGVAAQGDPKDIITPELLKSVFDLDAEVMVNPVSGGPLVVPK